MRRRVALYWCEGQVFDRAGDCGLLEVDTPWSSFTRGLSKRGAREAAARFVLPPWRRKLSQNGKTKKETHAPDYLHSHCSIFYFYCAAAAPSSTNVDTIEANNSAGRNIRI